LKVVYRESIWYSYIREVEIRYKVIYYGSDDLM